MVVGMSKKSRKKSRRDKYSPIPHRTAVQDDYLKRRDQIVSTVGKKYNCHVHTQRIRRMGLPDELILQIASYKVGRGARVTRDEAHEILGMFRNTFPELARISFRLGE